VPNENQSYSLLNIKINNAKILKMKTQAKKYDFDKMLYKASQVNM